MIAKITEILFLNSLRTRKLNNNRDAAEEQNGKILSQNSSIPEKEYTIFDKTIKNGGQH
ncbi:MAG: hypothetical protein ACI37Z_02950 [Candidatus Gastranaerophilaceae bacterium]